MASELLGRRHLAEVDPLQSRESGSSVAVRAKFESSSDRFRKTPCFVLFRSWVAGSNRVRLRKAGGILAGGPGGAGEGGWNPGRRIGGAASCLGATASPAWLPPSRPS